MAIDKDAKIRKLEAALEFYSDPGDYKAPYTGGMGKLWHDCGAVARAALGEAFPGEEDRARETAITPYPNPNR